MLQISSSFVTKYSSIILNLYCSCSAENFLGNQKVCEHGQIIGLVHVHEHRWEMPVLFN